MVVLTHTSQLSKQTYHSSAFSKRKGSLKGQDENYNRRLFNLVAFLVLTAVLIKFIVEFHIQERLRLKLNKPPPNYKTHRLEEQHEIVEVILHDQQQQMLDAEKAKVHPLEDDYDFPFQVEVIEIPPSSSLLNISDFKWIRNNMTLCSENLSPFNKLLPVLIHTSRSHFMERKAIRDSWASMRNYRNWSVRPIFLIGESGRGEFDEDGLFEEEQLDNEHQQYGDLITGTFLDSYRNLTYKHLMGYKWILEHCSAASFVLKTDDDMFVDVLHFIDKFEGNDKTGTDIYCYEFVGSGPFRQKGNKWYVTQEEWSEPKYPFYCSGWGYGMSVNWIDRLYMMSHAAKYFWVDDVFIGSLINMASSFYREEPKVENINGLYTFDNKVYVGMCKNGSIDKPFLANAKRKFGSVVYVARGNEFGMQMDCMWRKTLMDRKMLD